MLPYFILLFVVIILSFMSENVRSNKKIYNLYIILIFLVLVLFAGLRSKVVGTDTGMYVGRYLRVNHDITGLINNTSRIEIGYRFLEFYASKISENYIIILLMIAFITIYFQLKGIYKLSVNPSISLFVIITFGIYTYIFNGARQGIAAAIYLYTLNYLIKGNFKKYALWVFIAFLFHKSVIIMIPMYYLFKKEFNYKLLALITISTVIIIIFYQEILNLGSFVNENYRSYQDIKEQGGKSLTIAYVLLSIFFIVMRKSIKLKFIKSYDIYLNMFLIGTVIFLVVFFTSSYVEITRIAFYFILSSVFIWPIVFKSLSQNKILLIIVFFILLHLSYYYIFLSRMSGLTPYILNPRF